MIERLSGLALVDIGWRAADGEPFGVMMTASLAYWAYHYLTSAASYRERWGQGLTPDAAQLRGYVFQRLGGLLLLGVVPLVVGWALWGKGLGAYGVTWAGVEWGRSAAWVGGAAAALGPVVWAASGGAAHQAAYPQARLSGWTGRRWAVNTGSWAAYLLGYEAFFRGFLLWPLVEVFGVWPAVGVNTALYVYAHLPKAAGETLGCVVMGVVFALMALTTGAIWAPWLAHVLIATASEGFAVYRARQAARPG
jgi:membrane protease YdiL (CAAX protease family)